MYSIAIIGTGRMGKALASLFSKSFDEVVIVSRDEQKAKDTIHEIGQPSLQYLPVAEAILQSDIIVPALWYQDEISFAKQYAPLLQGKIYFNIAVPFTQDFNDLLLPYGSSAAEEMQSLLPATTVVGIFKTVFWPVLNVAPSATNLPDVYVTANDAATRQAMVNLLQPLPFRFIDAGGLAENKTIERMTLLSRKLGLTTGIYPNIAFNLWSQKR